MADTVTMTAAAEWRQLPKQERVRRNQAAIEALRSFMQGDAEEQRETLDFLCEALDQDRPSYRKLFPRETQG